jgi:hypothetical protein
LLSILRIAAGIIDGVYLDMPHTSVEERGARLSRALAQFHA